MPQDLAPVVNPSQAKLPTLRPAVAARLRQCAESWAMADPVPAGAVQYLEPAIAIEEARLAPVGPQGVAVFLDRLWAIFPQPDVEGLVAWTEALSPYPADLLRDGVAHLIATRTWQRDAPLPAMVLAPIRDEYRRRIDYRNRLKAMQTKARLEPPATRQSTPEEREAMLARMRDRFPEAFGIAQRMPGTAVGAGCRTSANDDEITDADIPRLQAALNAQIREAMGADH